MNLNNFLNVQNNQRQSSSNYERIKQFLYKLRFIFYSLIFLILCANNLFHCLEDKIYIKNHKFLEKKSLSSKKIPNKRKLNNSTTLSLSEMVNSTKENHKLTDKIIKEKYNGDYYFIMNLTAHEYYGNWTKLSTNFESNNRFFNQKLTQGITELTFRKVKNKNNIILNFDNNKPNTFRIFAILREGKYADKYFKLNFIFSIPNGLNFESIIKNNKTIDLYNNNTKLEVSKITLLKEANVEKIENCNISLIIYNEPFSIMLSFKKKLYTQFHKIKLIFESPKFNTTIDSELYNDEKMVYKVRIYTFILSCFGIIEIYQVFKLMIKLNGNNQVGVNLSIINLSINCYYKAFICVIHFFLSITNTNEDMSYEFGVPTIIYFFAFTGFELKLLAQTIKARYIDTVGLEPFRRKLLFYYTCFYIILALILINMREILTNFFIILIIYSTFWLSQILHSIYTSTRPPMSRSYIFYNTLSKLYLPIYIKSYEENIFDLKPSYIKTWTIVIIVFIEMVILLLQKTFGARTILPKKYRKVGFDYYRDKVNVNLHISKNPTCVICLENLSSNVDENFNVLNQQKNKKKCLLYKILNCYLFTVFFEKINKWLNNIEGKPTKKKYMITPCDHVFHTVCLEKWLKMKSECPYCKRALPPFE